MQQLLLVNPKKRTARRKSTKAASPAQKRARAAFAAAARARSKNPAKRRAGAKRTRRASPTVTIMANPRKRRTLRRKSASVKRHSRRRRNPGHSLMSKPMSIMTPALLGALGATAVNTILNQLPIPTQFTTGNAQYATRAVAAIGLAMLGSKLGMRGAMVKQMAEGSLTVTFHDAIQSFAGSAGLNLNGMRGMGVYMPGINASRPGQYARPAQSVQGLRSVGNANGGGYNVNGINGMGKYVNGPGALVSTTRTLKGANGGFNF